jgi:hypothetical protein
MAATRTSHRQIAATRFDSSSPILRCDALLLAHGDLPFQPIGLVSQRGN